MITVPHPAWRSAPLRALSPASAILRSAARQIVRPIRAFGLGRALFSLALFGVALFGVALGLLAGPAAADAPLCGSDSVCRVAVGEQTRTYRIQPPDGWDGVTPLPVLVHFHGWGRTARFVLGNARQAAPAHRTGVLLVALDADGPTWAFRTPESPDVRFLDAVMADLPSRAPIDRSRVILSGFSHGGSMVWRAACDRGPAFAGYTSIAGTIQGFDTAACQGGPARMLQVHGTRDRALFPPLGGPGPDDDFALWRSAGACAGTPDETRIVDGRFQCRHWTRCDAGASAGLCLLDAQHANPRRWLDYAIPRLLAEADG